MNRLIYRSRALAKRRDPEQDAKNRAALAARVDRVAAKLVDCPVNQRLNAAAASRSSVGTD
jgi:hypothetical protein